MSHAVLTESFKEIESEWEKMLPHCATNTIFITPWWQKIWWQRFQNGIELKIISFHENETVLGIAPMILNTGVLSFLGGSDLFDYHDFIVPEYNEILFYNALFEYLPEVQWNVIEMKSLPEKSPTLRYVPAIAKKMGYSVEVSNESVSPIASLSPTWEGYLENLSKKPRHELKRKMRRLESAGTIQQYICESPQTHSNCMKDFIRLMQASSSEKAAFLNPQREEFFIDLATELGARNNIRLAILELNGIRVAACMSFDYLNSYLLYNSGYDPSYSKLSVGLVNKALAIKRAIEVGKDSFDFLRGAERYKYELGATNHSVYQIIIRR